MGAKVPDYNSAIVVICHFLDYVQDRNSPRLGTGD